MLQNKFRLIISVIIVNIVTISVFAQNTVDVNSSSWVSVQTIEGDNGLPSTVYEIQNAPDGYYQFTDMQITVMEGEIASSVKQGVWIYYVNGILSEKIEYLDGVQNGLYEAYYPNGQLRVQCTFVDGEAHGSYIVYDTQGNITMQNTMSNGLIIQE
ncbi:MAG: hypothetical protein C0592_11085 [Marinilabiliales bacterium]|nr:MAG: hypothetical protein C0592_11085 [Marinilabiliales bacterium]